MAVATTPADLRHLPFDAMKGFPALFRTYCTDYDAVASFYAGDWRDPEAHRAAAKRTAAFERNREALADILQDQNERWGINQAASEHIDALRAHDTVAVVTGQQVGLFTGPLYTPYKTLTTLQLAQRLAEEMDRPVVPVFWLEGGDHDLEEIAGTTLLRRNEVVHLKYTGHTLPEVGNLGPVGRLKLTEQVERVLERVDDILPPSDFHETVMTHLRDAYRPGTTLLDAFARFMRALFPEAGLVFIDPDDPRLKELAAPLFRREIDDYETSYEALRQVSDTLEARYHAQVHPRRTNLFLVEKEGRFPLEPADDGFRLRGLDRTYTREALHRLLDEEPHRFSPNVVLRPLMQDVLLPTAAYVAGPGEVSYFAQYRPVYEWADVPMPIVYPRASVSLVESKVQKVLDRYHLRVADFAEPPEQVFQRVVVEEMEVDVEAVFKDAARHLHEAVNVLKPSVEQVDRTLVRAAEATRAALMKEFGKLKGRVLRAEKQNQDVVREQLEKAAVNLFPDGGLQERTLSVLYFLNKYGLTLPQQLRSTLSLDTSEHQVVEV